MSIHARLQRLEAAMLPTGATGATLADWIAYHSGQMTEEAYQIKLSPADVARMHQARTLAALALADFEDEPL